jgi:RimJ/RimL family protein N-acetyltransferase
MTTEVSDHGPSVSVPRILTPRLLLREFRIADFDAYAEHVADPIAQASLSGPVDRRAAARLFAAASGAWMLYGAGWWAIEHRATGNVVGTVGAFFRESHQDLELGWSLYRAFWQQGFATEAARAALDFALVKHGRTRAIALIDSANTASIRVSERIGMGYERDVDFFGTQTGCYAIGSAKFPSE